MRASRVVLEGDDAGSEGDAEGHDEGYGQNHGHHPVVVRPIQLLPAENTGE